MKTSKKRTNGRLIIFRYILLQLLLWSCGTLYPTPQQKRSTDLTTPPLLKTLSLARASLRQELHTEALIAYDTQNSRLLKKFLSVRQKQLLNATTILCLLEISTRFMQNNDPTTLAHTHLCHATNHVKWICSALNSRIALLEKHIATDQPHHHKIEK